MVEHRAGVTRGVRPWPEHVEIVQCRAHVGSVIVAEVVELGADPVVELPTGRVARFERGDRIVGVLGNRFSTQSTFGVVPEDGIETASGSLLDLLEDSGIMGMLVSCPAYVPTPSRVRILGAAATCQDPACALALGPTTADTCPAVPVILVGGTASNVGKTTFARSLIHRLSGNLGLHVGAAKFTGTGCLRDILTLRDAGAVEGLDFVDVGLVSTYGIPDAIVAGCAREIVRRLHTSAVDVVVGELGGDLTGGGVESILRDAAHGGWEVRALVIVPSDTMASLGAAAWLRDEHIELRVFHAMPYRNHVAARDRMRRTLGVSPIDWASDDDMEPLLRAVWPATNRG